MAATKRLASDNELDALQPPQAIDAEQSVLGACLKDPDALQLVVDVLANESHFYSPKHQIIYRAILEMYRANDPVDITTLSNVLLGKKDLEQIGGRVYLVDLVEGVISSAHVEAHATIVREKAVLRSLIATCSEVSRSAYEMTIPGDELLARASESISRISQTAVRGDFQHISEGMDVTLREIEFAGTDQAAVKHVPTGFIDIDAKSCGGMAPKDLWVIAGLASAGKSSLAMTIADNVARQGIPVAFFSLEMPREKVQRRLLSSYAELPLSRLLAKDKSDAELRAIAEAETKITRLPLFIDDSTEVTPLQAETRARRLKARFPDLGLIVVDYLQLMKPPRENAIRELEVNAIGKGLVILGKHLNVPVLALAQLNKPEHGKKSTQWDIRESRSIVHHADVIIILRAKGNLSEVCLAKNRDGEGGEDDRPTNLLFQKHLTRFRDVSGRKDGEGVR